MLSIYDLKTEYLRDPMGIDALQPRFSWKLNSNKNGVVQKSYRIVARTGETILWDSGLVASSQSQRVRYEGEPLVSRQQVEWTVTVMVQDDFLDVETATSSPARFEMGLLEKADWTAQWIEPEDEVDPEALKPAPYLRKTFTVRPGLVRARIYQTAHGLYEFWLNGQRGTEDVFKPGLTSYYYRIQYQTYDVTGLLQEGENVWAVALGDGWWRGSTGGTLKNNFGYKLHFFGQLELYYDDGTSEMIGTDESFRHSTGGLLESDMMFGDLYDASREPAGWKEPGFDDSSWAPVHLSTEHTDAALIPSRSVPVREKEKFIPHVLKDSNGDTVLDFGQNIAGYVKMHLRNTKPGQHITLVHGEDMKDGHFSIDNINQCTFPIPKFQQVDYVCAGAAEEWYHPLFSIFGFRYVKLTGYDEEIRHGEFVAYAVYSDMEEVGNFQCSNPLINQLVSNSRWSQKGNFMDVATDCPTRERNAWTGDAQIYARTATDFMNVYPFYEKWLQDQAIEQFDSGKVGITFPSTSSCHNPDYLPVCQKNNPVAALAGPTGNGNIGEDCAGWGDSAAYIPYIMYLCYGDKQILENQYDTAKRWVDYMLTCAKDHNPLYEDQPQYHHIDAAGELDADYIYDTKMHYGEWQEPIPRENTGESLQEAFMRMIREGKPKVATAYMCRSAENVSDMAKVLGKKEDYHKYRRICKKIRSVYNRYLIAEDGTIEPGHQAAYVRALRMELCGKRKREKVLQHLVKEVEANDFKLNTGFLSTPFLLPVLAENGQLEAAYKILEGTEFPSWLHPIELGATTIPEAWNAYDIHDSSYNHYSYGAVCDFLFGYVAGIQPVWEEPGYKKFKITPMPGGSLTQAKAIYESQYGTIISGWVVIGDRICYNFKIPVNTFAEITLPNGETKTLGSGTYQFFQDRCV